VVGTGRRNLHINTGPQLPISEILRTNMFGVLELTLEPDAYTALRRRRRPHRRPKQRNLPLAAAPRLGAQPGLACPRRRRTTAQAGSAGFRRLRGCASNDQVLAGSSHSSGADAVADRLETSSFTRREPRRSRATPLPPSPVSSAREPRPHACAAICGPTTVTSGIGCSAHCGGSTPAASAAMRAQWRSKPAGVQTST
jgi:hypothetical protein